MNKNTKESEIEKTLKELLEQATKTDEEMATLEGVYLQGQNFSDKQIAEAYALTVALKELVTSAKEKGKTLRMMFKA